MSRPRRSVLILPGANRHMAEKAAAAPADQVILDLEDALPADPAAKAAARSAVLEIIGSLDFGSRALSVRVNRPGSADCLDDLLAVVPSCGARLASVVLPKVSGPEDVWFADRLLSSVEATAPTAGHPGLEAQIESAVGLERVSEIAAAGPRLESLIFGPGDYAASMGMPQLVIGRGDAAYPGDLWHFALCRIAVAARSRGLLVIDGPWSDLTDGAGLESSSRRAAALGLDGKWAIHPAQLETINRAFTPDPDQVERARRILEALEQRGGAARLDGEMIDEAHRRMAEQLLARAEPRPGR
ncbi:MAG: HpcH/HpaI aldolase/citrate lyase family protein [Candidatus Dormibacteria bacterium]